jgi:hypothetical protein
MLLPREWTNGAKLSANWLGGTRGMHVSVCGCMCQVCCPGSHLKITDAKSLGLPLDFTNAHREHMPMRGLEKDIKGLHRVLTRCLLSLRIYTATSTF